MRVAKYRAIYHRIYWANRGSNVTMFFVTVGHPISTFFSLFELAYRFTYGIPSAFLRGIDYVRISSRRVLNGSLIFEVLPDGVLVWAGEELTEGMFEGTSPVPPTAYDFPGASGHCTFGSLHASGCGSGILRDHNTSISSGKTVPITFVGALTVLWYQRRLWLQTRWRFSIIPSKGEHVSFALYMV